jgi:hypothetical protein
MMRDELLKQIAALRPDADVGIQIGDDHLDIAGLVPWGNGGFVALKCHSADLRDVLVEWGLSAGQREKAFPGHSQREGDRLADGIPDERAVDP